jgi:hypothetical protein
MKEMKIRSDENRAVKLELQLSTYGSEEDAIDLARHATRQLAVSLGKTITCTYHSHTFIYNGAGRASDDPDF